MPYGHRSQSNQLMLGHQGIAANVINSRPQRYQMGFGLGVGMGMGMRGGMMNNFGRGVYPGMGGFIPFPRSNYRRSMRPRRSPAVSFGWGGHQGPMMAGRGQYPGGPLGPNLGGWGQFPLDPRRRARNLPLRVAPRSRPSPFWGGRGMDMYSDPRMGRYGDYDDFDDDDGFSDDDDYEDDFYSTDSFDDADCRGGYGGMGTNYGPRRGPYADWDD